MLTTMSTAVAPSSRPSSISANFIAVDVQPYGKEIAVPTRVSEPARTSATTGVQ